MDHFQSSVFLFLSTYRLPWLQKVEEGRFTEIPAHLTPKRAKKTANKKQAPVASLVALEHSFELDLDIVVNRPQTGKD